MEMTDNEQDAVNDFLNILEVEPSNDSDNREQLAVLVATGKAKEIIEQDLTQDKVKRLSRKDIEGYFRKSLAYFHPVDEGKLLKDLNENFAVKRELAMIAGALNL
ncbi:hypothetical protein pdam_00008539, partial [Pocillopora damicornis]